MGNEYDPWAIFHSTDMGDNLEEVVETEECKVLTDDLTRNYTTEELAKRFDLSVAALKTGFKGVYGSPIYTYIRTHKMNMAASMLVTDRKKRIIDIASAVGYDNPSKFAAAFKEIFGMTPAKYRNDRR